MGHIQCFFLEPSDQVEISLRRYASLSKCDRSGYHNASVVIDRDLQINVSDVHGDSFSHADQRWPKTCACGYEFGPNDQWQYNPHTLYRRADNGELMTLGDAPDGAMWFAPWYGDVPEWRGPDGLTLVVRVPKKHDWIVDSRASNCTMPQDNVHKCWVRHGSPPNITVDKNGNTCSAGAGSIAVPGWHGFLRNGYLEEA